MHPEISTLLIEKQVADREADKRSKEAAKVAKARDAGKSLGGSRASGITYKDPKSEPDDDIEAEVRMAYRQHSQA
jgi:hypothetical protein